MPPVKIEIDPFVTAASTATIPHGFARRSIPLLDLTTLNYNDNEQTIEELCLKVTTPYGTVASVCVYPAFVKQAKTLLLNTPVKIGTVANFPHGGANLTTTLSTIAQAIADGAQEIDLVMPYQSYIAGDHAFVSTFIRTCKMSCQNITLKIILETGALQTAESIYHASCLAINAGADFIKTSTGKIAVNATLPAAAAMLLAIRDNHKAVGFKAAGGIRTAAQANSYIYLAKAIMGGDWVNPMTFRLGASSLLDDLCKHA